MQDSRFKTKIAARPEDARQAGMAQTILNNVHRLKQVLDEENRLLEGSKSADHQPFIDKKNQILRELLALQSMNISLSEMPEIKNALQEVRPLVDKNHSLLLAHTAALSDITGLLTAAAAQDESDGTYSRYGDMP
jgi:flagellar biosynthesis/type III secretory pathway chaperone